MLSDGQIEKSRVALKEAASFLGGSKLGSMVFHAQARVCLFVGDRKLIDKETMPVRFVYDSNHPKVFVDRFGLSDFYTEFSVGWQEMRFLEERALLVVKGKHHQRGDSYKVHLHLRNARAVRGV